MSIRSFSIGSGFAILVLSGCGGSASSNGGSGGSPSGGGGTGAASSTGGNGPGQTSPVAAATLGSALARAYCPAIAQCCTSAGIASDVAACSTTLQTFLDAEVKLTSGNPKIAYDANAGARCVEAYRAAASACTDRAVSDRVSAACKVFVGTVPPGGACAVGNECVPPATGYVSCDTAICVAHPETFGTSGSHAQLGEPCSGSCSGNANTSSCSGNGVSTAGGSCWDADNLYCGPSGTCEPSPKVGEPCADANYCEAAAHCQTGTCTADSASGACNNTGDCLATSYCDTSAAPAHCAPRKANGLACNDDAECVGGQCELDHCRNWSVATQASCAGIFDD